MLKVLRRPVEPTHYKMQPNRAMLARRASSKARAVRATAYCFGHEVIESSSAPGSLYFQLAASNSIGALDAGVHAYVTTTTMSSSALSCRRSAR